MQTICAHCRTALENQVMAITAGSYAPPTSRAPRRGVREPVKLEADANAAVSTAGVEVAEKPSDADSDVLPLAPLESTAFHPATSKSVATQRQIPAPALPPLKARLAAGAVAKPSTAKSDKGIALDSPGRWKFTFIALIAIVVAAAIGGLIWYFIVPTSADEPTETQIRSSNFDPGSVLQSMTAAQPTPQPGPAPATVPAPATRPAATPRAATKPAAGATRPTTRPSTRQARPASRPSPRS